MQLDEQSRLVDQLKQSLNGCKAEYDKQKAKLDSNNKLLNQQLSDCNKKIELLEKEILVYKERVHKLKYESDATTTQANGISSSSSNSGGGLKQSDQISSSSSAKQLVKMPRKDLRVLSEEELMKRSLKKEGNSLSGGPNDADVK